MLALRESVRQRRALLRDEKNTRAGSSPPGRRQRCLRHKGRDGAEKSYFVCQTMRGCRFAALLNFPPGANLPKGDEVGRGEGQDYFAYYAGGRGFDSHLAKRFLQPRGSRAGASSSVVRAPDVPWPLVPVQQFARRGQMEKHGTQLGQPLLPEGRRGVGFLNRSTFRLHRQS